MYDTIKASFKRLVEIQEFNELVSDFRRRFGIPHDGFDLSKPEEYKTWVINAFKKSDYLRDSFLFIAKRCKNLAPNDDPIPLTILATYFFFNSIPIKKLDNLNLYFSIKPSGVLGNFDIIFTVPLLFTLEELFKEIDKNKSKIEQTVKDTQTAIENFKIEDKKAQFNQKYDLLETTPGNGSDLVDRVHRDIAYLAEFGRVILREHLGNMKPTDFIINKYQDKNKPISAPVQQMGNFLLHRNLFPIMEVYWKQIDEEIINFNHTTGNKVNRGIPLANQGVAQIAQGKVIEGLFNIYKGYENDRLSLQHIPGITIDPEKDMAKSILYTQFEEAQISRLFDILVSKFSHVFQTTLSKKDLADFVSNLNPDKKLLFYITLYRFSFALALNSELTNIISRSEILRSLAELALWFEDELKRKDPVLLGKTLVEILDQKVGLLNPVSGQYTRVTSLTELTTKISSILRASTTLDLTNARVIGALRNFAGHNLEVQNHTFFQTCDEIFARMLSFIIYSKNQGWI